MYVVFVIILQVISFFSYAVIIVFVLCEVSLWTGVGSGMRISWPVAVSVFLNLYKYNNGTFKNFESINLVALGKCTCSIWFLDVCDCKVLRLIL
jgi:hypothetical protein